MGSPRPPFDFAQGERSSQHHPASAVPAKAGISCHRRKERASRAPPSPFGLARISNRTAIARARAGGEGSQDTPQTLPSPRLPLPLIPNPSPKGEGGVRSPRLALWAVINMTNAHLRPLTLRRSLKQHVGCMKATGRNAPSLRPIQNGALRYA